MHIFCSVTLFEEELCDLLRCLKTQSADCLAAKIISTFNDHHAQRNIYKSHIPAGTTRTMLGSVQTQDIVTGINSDR